MYWHFDHFSRKILWNSITAWPIAQPSGIHIHLRLMDRNKSLESLVYMMQIVVKEYIHKWKVN